jgi:outer membrane protein insertion porin family
MHLPPSRLRRALRSPVLALAAACLVQAPWAWAVEPFVLRDIRVEGLQRGDAGTVFAALPFRVGDTYNDEKGAAALRALFGTGLFKDVRLDIDGDVVVVVVDERPVVASVAFVGLKEFEKDALIKALRDNGIAEGLAFDRALIDRAEQELKRQYLSRSLYGAEVVTTVTPIERNRVNISFTISEGEVARIREIRIVGNKVFPESELLDLLDQSTSGWMTWYTKSDRYSRTKLNADLETLKAHYLNRGYLEFSVEGTQVTISPDKQNIDITLTVREGQPFTVTEIKLEGELLGRDDEFRALISIRPGQPYRAADVAETVRAMVERYGAYGYAFARIDPRTDIDRERGQVALTLAAEPGRRVYVRRINVAGNDRTRDEVVRREMRQFEAAWYDGQRIKLSRDRVDRLGYFKSVEVETLEVPGAPDQVDLTINVEERPTGNLMLGAGYSTAENLTLTASIKQENAFGSGNYLGIEFNTSKVNRLLVLSTVDPYFTVDGVSRAVDLFYRTTRPLNSQGESYKLVTPGVAVRFGIPLSDNDTVYLGLGAESTKIEGDRGLPNNYYLYREQFGARATSFPLTLGWSRDHRDSVIAPTRGSYQRVNLEWGVAGDTRYLRNNLQVQHYLPLSPKFTLGLNGEVGWGRGLGGREYPVFKNFYGGGLGTVRVFDQGSLGPVDVTGAYSGGSRRLNLNAELYVPFPGAGNDKSLRIFGFMDAGNVWGFNQKVELSSLRSSLGVGLSWLSPVGPLKLSWGSPIRKQPTDRIERLQFQIGTAF